MRVFELMTTDVQTVPPTMPVAEAQELMRRHGIHHLVVTEHSLVTGILSARDTIVPLGDGSPNGRLVSDVMTKHVVSVAPRDPVRKAANVLRGRTIGCVPVIQRGKLVGILTLSDLLEMIGRGADRPRAKERRIATHRVPHRRTAAATGMW
jgi:CBS domain-containing protein